MKKILLLLAVAMLTASAQSVTYAGPKTPISQLNASVGELNDDLDFGGHAAIDIDSGSDWSTISYQTSTGFRACFQNGTEIYSGSNATLAIQYAMDNLTSGRTWKEKTVFSGSGTLNGRIRIPSYTHLALDGRLTAGIAVADGNNYFDNLIGNSGCTKAGDWISADLTSANALNREIEVSGGTIDAAGLCKNLFGMNAVEGVYVHGINFTQPTTGSYGGITFRSKDVRFEVCTLEKVWITNICDGAKNVVVDSITARDTQDSPISVGTGATEGTYKTQDIIIQNCNMSLRKQAEGSGIDFYGDVMNFRVVGNSINGSAWDGIHAIIDGGPYSAPRFGLISGNRVCGTRAGFGIATSGTSAVYPHDIIITENIVTGGFSGGIAVQGGRNYTVTNNICYANHGRGIYVAADGANLYNAILEGNTCYDVGGVQNYGIHLMKSGAGLGQVVVLGNNLIGNVDANYIAVGSPTNVTNEHNLGYP